MKIVSWNVNSVRVREAQLTSLVQDHSLDVVALQETKCAINDFPSNLLRQTHVHRSIVGDKGRSGVAFLSREPLSIECEQLPGENEQTARFLHVRVGALHLMNIYAVNGESLTSDKFVYKKQFYQNLISYVKKYVHEPCILMGDLNIAAHVRDVYAPQHFQQRLLFSVDERAWLRSLLCLPFYDIHHYAMLDRKNTERYTWWDYRNMAYFPEKGLRIDFMLASAKAYDAVLGCGIVGSYRQNERPSDHVPIWCEYNQS